jgi:hypothetical protein
VNKIKTYLSTCLSSSILSPFNKASIPVCSDYPII